MHDIGFINGKAFVEGKLSLMDVYVTDDKISHISSPGEKIECKETVDCTDKLVLPGLIDPHVHLNLDLGEFKSCDDYITGSKAAAFGGITTFIDFLEPIKENCDFKVMFERKRKEASGCHVDYAWHTTLGNFKDDVDTLFKISKEAGIKTIKLFTTYSESDRRCGDSIINALLKKTSGTDMVIMIHAENDQIILDADCSRTVENFECTRPSMSEISEVKTLTKMAHENQGNLYLVHTTCGSSVDHIKKKYPTELGKNIFIESCPQYFTFTREAFAGVNGRLHLLAPPMRSTEEHDLLVNNLLNITTIGTDHCPFLKEEKLKYDDIDKIPKGIGGLEYSFPLLYSMFGEDIIDRFTINPAKVHGLYPNKGTLDEGSDADIIIFDPKKEWTIDEKGNGGHSACDHTVYVDKKVKGKVISTILRGIFIVKDGVFVGEGNGEYQRRIR